MCISCSCRICRLRLHDFPISFSSPREFMSGLFFIAKHKWGKKVSQSRFYSIYFLFLQYVQNTIANLMSARVLYLYCVCLLCRPDVPLIHTVWYSLISVSGVARSRSWWTKKLRKKSVYLDHKSIIPHCCGWKLVLSNGFALQNNVNSKLFLQRVYLLFWAWEQRYLKNETQKQKLRIGCYCLDVMVLYVWKVLFFWFCVLIIKKNVFTEEQDSIFITGQRFECTF